MNKLFSLNREPLLLFFLNYTAFSLPLLLSSPLFSIWKLLLSILIFTIIDELFNRIFKEKGGWKGIICILISTFSFIILFGFLFSIAIQSLINVYTNYGLIRGQYIFVILTLIFFVVQLLFIKKRTAFLRFTNIFLILLFCLSFSSSILKIAKKNVRGFDKFNFNSKSVSDVIKPRIQNSVLLLVADEYSSPSELYNVFNDSSVFSFSESLKMRGWKVRNNLLSREVSTIHSIASLMNMNLSVDGSFGGVEPFIASEYLINPLLLKNLQKKGIGFFNLSIFNIGNTQALTELYFYPQNFTELLFFNSAYLLLQRRIKEIELDKKNINKTMVELHNNKILNGIDFNTNNRKNLNSFVYAHLYMPHSPIRFYDEIRIDEYNLENYYKYWNHSNNKIDFLLQKLTKYNRYKIILIGDHGFRSDSRVNPNITFAAFYGFAEDELKRIESVQDIGLIIDSSF